MRILQRRHLDFAAVTAVVVGSIGRTLKEKSAALMPLPKVTVG
jgi:hypothetical protein